MSDINTYTTAEIANLTPQSGDLVLNTDDNAVQLWNGSAWKVFNSDVSPFPNTKSVSFDGANEYAGSLAIPRNSGSWSTTTPITLSAWVKLNSWNSDDALFGIGQLGSNGSKPAGHLLGNFSGIHLLANSFYLHQDGVQRNISVTATAGVWYHIVWTWDGSNGVVYFNGSSELTFTDTSNAFQSTMHIWAGGQGRWNGYPANTIDEIAFWDSALSSSNVSQMYSSGTPNDISGLSPLVWYRMGDGTENGSGDEIFDMSGTTRSAGSWGHEASLKLFNTPTFSTDIPS